MYRPNVFVSTLCVALYSSTCLAEGEYALVDSTAAHEGGTYVASGGVTTADIDGDKAYFKMVVANQDRRSGMVRASVPNEAGAGVGDNMEIQVEYELEPGSGDFVSASVQIMPVTGYSLVLSDEAVVDRVLYAVYSEEIGSSQVVVTDEPFPLVGWLVVVGAAALLSPAILCFTKDDRDLVAEASGSLENMGSVAVKLSCT